MECAVLKSSVRRKLYLIYALNVADWLCTVVLLHSGDFLEANPLARLFIGSLPLGFAVKCVLTGLIVLLIIRMLRPLNSAEAHTVDCFVCFAATFYTALCADHVINFLILFFRE